MTVTLHNRLFLVALFGASLLWHACDELTESEPLNKRTVAKVEKTDDVVKKCLAIKDGDILTEPQNATYKNVGFVLMLNSQGRLSSICTGYLVKPDVVLTAQHCIANNSQVPRLPERVLFTFTDLDSIIKAVQENRPWDATEVKSIIPWAEQGQPFRDVALLHLTKRYDETYIPFDLMQNPVPTPNTDIVMVGYGNYVKEGEAAETFDQGIRRIGTAKFIGYDDEPFPQFNNPDFIRVANYMNLEPSGAKKQMICQGDSGSSVFWDQGHTNFIAGVTSMQIIANYTEEFEAYDDCENSALGLFVPSHEIRDWVNGELTNINESYALPTYSSFEAKIDNISETPAADTLSLTITRHMDNGLAIAESAITATLCKQNCGRYADLSAPVTKGLSVLVTVEKVEDKFVITRTTVEPISRIVHAAINCVIAIVTGQRFGF